MASQLMLSPPQLRGSVASRWQAFAPRERRLIAIALAVVAAALLWWVAIAPAWTVLKAAPAQRQALDEQLEQMQSLRAQAQTLQALPKIKGAEAARALESLVKQRFGASASWALAGNQATVTLSNARADALAQFIGQARAQANALPSQARLRRSSNPELWDGTLVLLLPAS